MARDRFLVLRTGALLAAASLAGSAAGQSGIAPNYPVKPVRIIVTTTPGGGPDIVARLFGAKLAESFRQQVIVDNRAGAGGRIGTEVAASSAPDGYTLIVMTAQHVIAAALYAKSVKYDLVRDFAPVILIGTTPFIAVVHPSLPARSVKELVALAKARPGELHYGTGGAGTPPHLAAELFQSLTGTRMVHVPYKGVAQALVDTASGQVQLTFAVIPASLPLIRSGKVRALGVTSTRRTPLVPDLPTVAETVPGFEFIDWYSLAAPAGTPAEILARLHAETARALKAPEIQEQLAGLGIEPVGSTPQELAAHLRAEIKKLGALVRASGASPD
ncbi:MAG TPA: tripartite tricarboxylate transporter substrate binding protein [Burkholderiales bacterium]|nr:tripartite tricarboxylate transporter substrate binding protein [Burkholderiales bacterium]